MCVYNYVCVYINIHIYNIYYISYIFYICIYLVGGREPEMHSITPIKNGLAHNIFHFLKE